MILDIIIENQTLFNAFKDVFLTKNIGYDKLVGEMHEDGITMDKKRLQRFITHGSQKRITQKAYIWLLLRHGITVTLKVSGKKITDEEGRLIAKNFTI